VLQGERSMATENNSIGKFVLDGILPAPRGIPQIEVTFDLDANGILNVSAKDKGTGKEQKITITASSGLSQEDVEKLVQEAEANADDDRKKKESVETRNLADNLIYTTEKTLAENSDKVPEELKTQIESKVATLKEALESNDDESIKSSLDDLQQTLQELGNAVYSQESENPNNETEEGTKSDDDETVEGEYREV
ncbi:MAG: molecular chaperone DnaK, partial [SAR202 cluster bacterium]|nr:molecular chaperone DnaK [SAR202 cluster bacterium]